MILVPVIDLMQGQVVRAGTSQGAAGIREASTQYFPYMFEYDVDLLTFFRIVDCGDIPIVPGNNEKSHEYIYHYLTECLHGGAKVVEVGTHDDLLARDGQYASLYAIQAAAYR